MARPRKDASSPPSKLSSGQASYVLDRLIKERRVSQSDISRYVTEMSREISDLEERLKHLYDAVGGAAASAASSIAAAAVSTVNAVRGRKPGRPAGSGRGPGRPPGSGRGPGRPPGTPGRKPGRPPASASAGMSGSDEGSSAATAGASSAKRGRKRAAITSEQLASRQLQGRYLALVRRFPASRRATFARTAKEKGREAAIKEMQDAMPKK